MGECNVWVGIVCNHGNNDTSNTKLLGLFLWQHHHAHYAALPHQLTLLRPWFHVVSTHMAAANTASAHSTVKAMLWAPHWTSRINGKVAIQALLNFVWYLEETLLLVTWGTLEGSGWSSRSELVPYGCSPFLIATRAVDMLLAAY